MMMKFMSKMPSGGPGGSAITAYSSELYADFALSAVPLISFGDFEAIPRRSSSAVARNDEKRSGETMNELIRTELDYKAALARVDALMGADVGTPEGEELSVLAELVGAYEAEHFPTELPTVARPGASYASPTLRQRAWWRLGFRIHHGDEPEGTEAMIGWQKTVTRMHFSFLDRVRLLISGKLYVATTAYGDTPSPLIVKTRLDWQIEPPGRGSP